MADSSRPAVKTVATNNKEKRRDEFERKTQKDRQERQDLVRGKKLPVTVTDQVRIMENDLRNAKQERHRLHERMTAIKQRMLAPADPMPLLEAQQEVATLRARLQEEQQATEERRNMLRALEEMATTNGAMAPVDPLDPSPEAKSMLALQGIITNLKKEIRIRDETINDQFRQQAQRILGNNAIEDPMAENDPTNAALREMEAELQEKDQVINDLVLQLRTNPTDETVARLRDQLQVVQAELAELNHDTEQTNIAYAHLHAQNELRAQQDREETARLTRELNAQVQARDAQIQNFEQQNQMLRATVNDVSGQYNRLFEQAATYIYNERLAHVGTLQRVNQYRQEVENYFQRREEQIQEMIRENQEYVDHIQAQLDLKDAQLGMTEEEFRNTNAQYHAEYELGRRQAEAAIAAAQQRAGELQRELRQQTQQQQQVIQQQEVAIQQMRAEHQQMQEAHARDIQAGMQMLDGQRRRREQERQASEAEQIRLNTEVNQLRQRLQQLEQQNQQLVGNRFREQTLALEREEAAARGTLSLELFRDQAVWSTRFRRQQLETEQQLQRIQLEEAHARAMLQEAERNLEQALSRQKPIQRDFIDDLLAAQGPQEDAAVFGDLFNEDNAAISLPGTPAPVQANLGTEEQQVNRLIGERPKGKSKKVNPRENVPAAATELGFVFPPAPDLFDQTKTPLRAVLKPRPEGMAPIERKIARSNLFKQAGLTSKSEGTRQRYTGGPRSWHTESSDAFQDIPMGANVFTPVGITRIKGAGLTGRPADMVAVATYDAQGKEHKEWRLFGDMRARDLPLRPNPDDDDLVAWNYKGKMGQGKKRYYITTYRHIYEQMADPKKAVRDAIKVLHFPGLRYIPQVIKHLKKDEFGNPYLEASVAQQWEVRYDQKIRTARKAHERVFAADQHGTNEQARAETALMNRLGAEALEEMKRDHPELFADVDVEVDPQAASVARSVAATSENTFDPYDDGESGDAMPEDAQPLLPFNPTRVVRTNNTPDALAAANQALLGMDTPPVVLQHRDAPTNGGEVAVGSLPTDTMDPRRALHKVAAQIFAPLAREGLARRSQTLRSPLPPEPVPEPEPPVRPWSETMAIADQQYRQRGGPAVRSPVDVTPLLAPVQPRAPPKPAARPR